MPNLIDETELIEAREEISRLHLTVANLSRDALRLDWLEATGFSTRDIGRGNDGVHCWRLNPADKWGWTVRNISSYFKSAREAIDACMEGK